MQTPVQYMLIGHTLYLFKKKNLNKTTTKDYAQALCCMKDKNINKNAQSA